MTSPAEDAVTDHRLGRAGCRCGWEEQASAFRWSGELRALVFTSDRVPVGRRDDYVPLGDPRGT